MSCFYATSFVGGEPMATVKLQIFSPICMRTYRIFLTSDLRGLGVKFPPVSSETPSLGSVATSNIPQDVSYGKWSWQLTVCDAERNPANEIKISNSSWRPVWRFNFHG